MAFPGFLLLSLAVSAVPPVYQRHEPIVIQNHPTSADKPLIIEGYEISNPDGPASRFETQIRRTPGNGLPVGRPFRADRDGPEGPSYVTNG
jgi:hypothetical protein